MNKMNKKGFTLIEMLVVIAIIAVLVSIIIPTVTSATDKAAAATNAANLRSIKAELTTAVLTAGKDGATVRGITIKTDTTNGYAIDASKFDNSVTFKEVTGYTDGFAATATKADGIIVTYGGLKIDQWAKLAAGETLTTGENN